MADRPDVFSEPFVVTLRVLPGYSGTPTSRVKRALKCLFRSFGLRCEGVASANECQPEPIRLRDDGEDTR